MKAEIIAFSERGLTLAKQIAANLPEQRGDTVGVFAGFGEGKINLQTFAKQAFCEADLIVFVGAAGIAVRAIAPYIRSKLTDPAVVVVDDGAKFSIPLLSGHIGGANRFARRIAEITGAVAAVTTSTDVHGVFAIDDWAARNGYWIENPKLIKRVSSALLSGERVGICCEPPVEGTLPAGLIFGKFPPDIRITVRTWEESETLHIVPPFAVLGIGCRKNTSVTTIERAFSVFCRKHHISPHAFSKVCSIDLKQQEAGILAFCERHQFAFYTYDSQQLSSVKGTFASSEFVQKVTGVDNVCERAAVLGAGQNGTLLVPKSIIDGVTFAAAVTGQTISFHMES